VSQGIDPRVYGPVNGSLFRVWYRRIGTGRHRYGLHALLFLLTLLTTTWMGTVFALNFEHGRHLHVNDLLGAFSLWKQPLTLLAGLPFSITLLTILLAHELGHYVACLYYEVDASLPYFLPAPTFIGTLGAFIRIRSPIYSKYALFDIGIAGPLAGFLFLIPALGIGLAYSKVAPVTTAQGDMLFGTPLLLEFCQRLVFPGAPLESIHLHPVARAAWVGLLATALNLLPIGQLDGGHILYALIGEKHRMLSRLFALALVPFGILYWHGWLVWALLLLLFGMRHPMIYDTRELTPDRKRLALVALAILAVSLTLTPIH
jgi:membrane-associated protease RseP (regulator of RpoE activity)